MEFGLGGGSVLSAKGKVGGRGLAKVVKEALQGSPSMTRAAWTLVANEST
jgi:hypothetical protein